MSLGILGAFASVATSAVAQPSSAIPSQQPSDAQVKALVLVQKVSSAMPKPACLPPDSYKTAQALCQKKYTGWQEAVAGLGSSDPYASAIALAPCDWALIPACATVPPKPPTRAPSKALAPTSSAPPLPPPPAPPKTDTSLIIGGVIMGALVLGGVYYAMRKKAA